MCNCAATRISVGRPGSSLSVPSFFAVSLLMASFRPAALAAVTSGSPAWHTGHPELDEFVGREIDLAVQDQLAAAPVTMRIKLLTTVKAKYEADLIKKPSPYLSKMLATEKMAPYGRGSAQPAQAGTAVVPARPRPVATPQHCGAGGGSACQGAPAWVLAAWENRGSKSSMLRIMARALPQQATAQLSSLPGQLQSVAAISLLLSPHFYSRPAEFFAEFARAMQALDAQMPKAVASPTIPAVAMVHFGFTSGFEVLGMTAAGEGLRFKDIPIHILDKIVCCPMGASFPVVLDMWQQDQTTPKTEHVHEALIGDVLAAKAAGWAAAGATVVVTMCVPTEPTVIERALDTRQPCAMDGSFLKFCQALARLHPRIESVLFNILVPGVLSEGDAAVLRTRFGAGLTGTSAALRLPTYSWDVYGSVGSSVAPEGSLTRELPRRELDDALHPKFASALADEAAYSLQLPTLSSIEKRIDDVEENGQQIRADDPVLQLVLQCQGAESEPLRLMDRHHLCDLAGISGWSYPLFWDDKLPCGNTVVKSTGLVCAEEHPDAVPCGQLRCCPNCAEFWQIISAAPSTYLYKEIIEACLERALKEGKTAVYFKVGNLAA